MKFLACATVALLWLTIAIPDANAVVCARGVYHAGCAGPHGAVVTHRHCYYRAGVRVCR
jgi:hypothetical protein